MARLPIDWDLIRLRYESGKTPYAISRDLGGRPSKQGIAKRAQREGWQQDASNILAVAEQLPIVKQAQALAGPSKCTAERVAFVLELIGRGSSPKMAAAAAGISSKTLSRWTKDDPQLAEQIRQARAGKLCEWVSHIDAAASRDWKAAKDLLAAAPDADDFNSQHHGGITIVLNIDRDGEAYKPSTIIEQDG